MGDKSRGRCRRPLYRNSLLLVRLRPAGRGWFPIPLALAVAAETLEGILDLIRLAVRFLPGANRPRHASGVGGPVGLIEILRLLVEAVEALRAGGRPYRLAAVETDAFKVIVDVI